MASSDRHFIAARLRALISVTTTNDLEFVAARLGVEELALRISIDEDSPHPVFEVLAAVVAEYGVDPTWLVTGEYDSSVHRQALAAGRSGALELIQQLAKPARPIPVQDNAPGELQVNLRDVQHSSPRHLTH